MKFVHLLFLGFAIFLLISSVRSQDEDREEVDEESEDTSIVTCGSVIKLKHVATGHRLHSHQVSYGSGSQQQSVTGFPNIEDPNSLWIVRNAMNSPHCKRGTPLKNGDLIRLQHLTTLKNLHSHLHQSPLTHQQEVSAFGDNGDGDTGDNWKIVVDTDGWKRGELVKFQHADTSKWLSSNKNKFSNPIPGQTEVCAIGKSNRDIEWIAEEGFFFPTVTTK